MQQLMLPMLKAMQRVAKDHNQNPQAGILLAKVSAPRYDNFHIDWFNRIPSLIWQICRSSLVVQRSTH